MNKPKPKPLIRVLYESGLLGAKPNIKKPTIPEEFRCFACGGMIGDDKKTCFWCGTKQDID
jgi:hypothetical protein